MYKIDRHIEILLLKHDCVIVPGFGGFTVHHIPARFDKNDGVMLPPMSTVGFNPQLIQNDSLLVQSFVETYDMSYPEAVREVESEVEELKGLIADNKSYDLQSVGTISVNNSGNYIFEPCQAGILSPQFYGLTGIDTNDAYAFDIDIASEESDHRIGLILRRTAIAACALAFLIALPFIGRQTGAQQMLSSFDFSFFTQLFQSAETTEATTVAPKQTQKITPVAPKTVEVTPVKKENTDAKQKEEVNVEAETQAKQEVPAKEEVTPTPFVIVLAARVPQDLAEGYVNELHRRGLSDARIIGTGKSRKVVCGEYKTEQEAHAAKRELTAHSEYADAWVFEVK